MNMSQQLDEAEALEQRRSRLLELLQQAVLSEDLKSRGARSVGEIDSQLLRLRNERLGSESTPIRIAA